jgi:hypothetical protein
VLRPPIETTRLISGVIREGLWEHHQRHPNYLIGARGRTHQFALGPMTCVKNREIFLVLTHIGHAEVLTHSVWKQLRVVRLLRPLDI